MRCFVENKVTTACNLGARAEKINDDLFYYACSQRVEFHKYHKYFCAKEIKSSQVINNTDLKSSYFLRQVYRVCAHSLGRFIDCLWLAHQNPDRPSWT